MHTQFELSSPWVSTEAATPTVWTRPDFGGRVELDRLTELPTDRKSWGERVLSRYLPEGGSISQLDISNSENHHGWPLTLTTTAALDPQGERVDTRITMFYEFLYFGTSLAVIIPNAAAGVWENSLREPVIEAMLHAAPSFPSDVANIAELWDSPRSGTGAGGAGGKG